MMRKTFLLAVFCMHIAALHAQFRFSIQGGANITTQVATNYHYDYARNEFLAGFNAGPSVDYRWGRHFFLHSAVILETKGTKGIVRQGIITADVKNRLLYLDVPLLIRGNIQTHNLLFFLEAGPYIGFGLRGRVLIETTGASKAWDIQWGTGTNDDFRRLDYGAIGGIGVEWKRFSLEGCFAYGLANIYALGQIGYDIEQRVFSLRAGYYFAR
jgi:hypothetical protein